LTVNKLSINQRNLFQDKLYFRSLNQQPYFYRTYIKINVYAVTSNKMMMMTSLSDAWLCRNCIIKRRNEFNKNNWT